MRFQAHTHTRDFVSIRKLKSKPSNLYEGVSTHLAGERTVSNVNSTDEVQLDFRKSQTTANTLIQFGLAIIGAL